MSVVLEVTDHDFGNGSLDGTARLSTCENDLVLREGVEPSIPCGHTVLSRARIPIPTPQHWLLWLDSNQQPQRLTGVYAPVTPQRNGWHLG